MRSASWAGCALAVVALVVSLACWTAVPDPMPTHWGLGGRPDGWSPRWFGLLLMPGMLAALAVLVPLTLRYGARAEHLQRSEAAVGTILVALLGVLFVMHLAMLHAVRTPEQRLPENLVVMVLGVAWIVMGNVLGKIRSNHFVGIRTPWTLRSEAVWHQTHRFAGFAFVGGGLLAVAACALPGTGKFAVAILGLAGSALAPVAYSWRAARAEAERG